MWIKLWTAKAKVRPKARSARSGDARRVAIRSPRQVISAISPSRPSRPIRSEFLAGDGEDEVGVGLGQEEELLEPGPVAAPDDAAAADGDQALVTLPAGGGGGVRVDEGAHPRQTIRRGHHCKNQRQNPGRGRRSDHPDGDPRDKRHGREDHQQEGPGTEIGLGDDEDGGERTDPHQRPQPASDASRHAGPGRVRPRQKR